MRFWLACFCFLFAYLFSFSLVRAQPFYALPESLYRFDKDEIVFSVDGLEYRYLPGFGWIDAGFSSSLISAEGRLFASQDLFEVFGLERLFLEDVRFGFQDAERIVFDLSDGVSVALQEGAVNGILELSLPILAVPLGLDLPEYLSLLEFPDQSLVRVTSAASSYRFFALENPARLVLDLVSESLPEADLAVLPELFSPRLGVTYERFNFEGSERASLVHVLSFAEGSGEFRVVGRSEGGAYVSDLADGGFAAINAGYFDPNGFRSIGYLKVAGGLLSLPSRNRSSVGFVNDELVMDRVSASALFYKDNVLIYQHDLADAGFVGFFDEANTWVGQASTGVITVVNGRVLENKIGPRLVPSNGFAVVYSPAIRELALLNAGDLFRYKIDIQPASLALSPYAVEAGPLLMKNGQIVYNPELERFQLGTRILEGVTQQAVVATRFNGDTLFIVAQTMNAADLFDLLSFLAVKDAMRLDSGSSTTLYLDGQLVNRTNQRRVTSALVFIPKP